MKTAMRGCGRYAAQIWEHGAHRNCCMSKGRKWWCFFKQDGVSMAYSYDLMHWTYIGRAEAGENVCVLVSGEEYVMLHSPDNGIGLKRSHELRAWQDDGILTLGRAGWPWAKGV